MVGEVRLKAILRILSPCRPGEGRVHLEDVVVNEMLGVCHEEDTEYSSELFTGTLPGGLSFLATASPHRLPIPILTSVNTSCSHSALSAMTKPGALPPSLPPLRKTEVSPFPCRTHPALSSPGLLDSTDSLSGEGAREVPQPSVGSCELFSNIPVAPCPMSTIMFKAS